MTATDNESKSGLPAGPEQVETSTSIQSVSRETRLFPPSPEFVSKARVNEYPIAYAPTVERPSDFWARQARELTWFRNFTTVQRGALPRTVWFEDGVTNIAYNCTSRYVGTAHANKAAIIWEGETGETRTLTYLQLEDEVVKLATALVQQGVVRGDRVAIYMGMVPEAAIAMLACAYIGAVHTVIFGGFAAEAVRDRVNDADAKLIITQDATYRRGQLVQLKEQVDRALPNCPGVQRVIVLKRTGTPVTMTEPRDVWWTDAIENPSAERLAAAPMDAEAPLFILYTSGTTGKPKGVVHTTGGYMVGTYATAKYVFDLREEDIYFCTADVGWITGHSYMVYGPLLNAATVLMYEGALNHPTPSRVFEVIARHRATIFYTAPTAIRAFIRVGDEHIKKNDLSSLRLLGSVGEPINPEAWTWYHRVVGGGRCPIVDTYWQTETGAIMCTPLPGAIAARPGSCAKPFFGITPKVLRGDGTPAGANEGGYLVVDTPWPSMMRTVWNDDARFLQYFEKFPGKYFTGDGARVDDDGYLWVMGRVDDVVNVSGHRLGTAEVESALVSHPHVAEAAVVSRPDELKGEALVAFVTLKSGNAATKALGDQLRDHVAKEIGKFARPDDIRFTDALPKTRSGKIMRRLLRDIARGNTGTGDVSTLEDLSVLARLKAEDE